MPPRWLEYEHCGAERYITSFGRILSDPEDMQRWRNYEARPCPGIPVFAPSRCYTADFEHLLGALRA